MRTLFNNNLKQLNISFVAGLDKVKEQKGAYQPTNEYTFLDLFQFIFYN